jgi:DNA-binding PadR family transcriptional regulator
MNNTIMSNAELAILSLIVEGDRHGYEIEELIQVRGMRNWTEVGFSSIYHILQVLEKAELVVSRIEKGPGKGPARKVFSATDTGRARYRKEVLIALARPKRLFPPFFQGLVGLPGIETKEAIAALESYREGLLARLKETEARFKEIEGADGAEVPFYITAMFSYSGALIKAEEAWVRNFIVELRDRSETNGAKTNT